MKPARALLLFLNLILILPLPQAGAEDFKQVTGPCHFIFPRDHGPHPGYRTEWWYYTGNVETLSGKPYGFQITFFRVETAPPEVEREWPGEPSAWRTRDLYFAHAALTAVQEKKFYPREKISRGVVGLAGVCEDAETTRIFLGPWSAEIGGERHRLKAVCDSFAFDLGCSVVKEPVAHGRGGYSRKGVNPESSSCYYSFPRLEVEGVLTLQGEKAPVRGTAWMDHEYSSAPLEQDLTGWDWFSIQLDDRTELMVYLLRLQKGGYSLASSGTFVRENGDAVHLGMEEIRVEALDRWKSARTGAVYPSRWRILVPSMGLDLLVVPNLADQELVTARTTGVTYWEGSVSVQGRAGQNRVKGKGYVELTGYAKPFQLLPPQQEGGMVE